MTSHPSAKNSKQPVLLHSKLFTGIECKERTILKSKCTDTAINDKIKLNYQLWTDNQNIKPKIHHNLCGPNIDSSPRFYLQKQRTHHYVFGFIRTHQLATNINIPHEIFNTIFNYCYIDNVKDLLKPIPILTMDMEVEIFIERLNLCCTIFDFKTNSNNECVAIQNKKERLSEIMDYLEMNDNIWMNKQILKCIMNMIQKNLFRSLPYININTPDYFYEFQDEQFEDPHFTHLCYIYEIALMCVKCINLNDKERKKIIGKRFVKPLVQLFASRDYREREYVKAILYEIYARNIGIRKVIRKELRNCCYRVIYSSYDSIENGIDECLQLMCSIIQGLSKPIKGEYILILSHILIPLHKVNIRILNKFNESLLKCLIQLIIKDSNIGLYILNNLLKYWPVQSAAKSDLFLKEIIVIINTIMFDINIDNINDENNIFKYNLFGIKIREKIIYKLIECIICDNYCLSEKALLSFQEDGIQKLIDINKQKTWNKILKVLFDQKNNHRHWCKKLKNSFQIVLNLFINRDKIFVEKFKNDYSQMCTITGNINEFKEGFYENGYNPIYPNQQLLFNHIKKNRNEKYKQIQIMAKKNKIKLLMSNKRYENKSNDNHRKLPLNRHKKSESNGYNNHRKVPLNRHKKSKSNGYNNDRKVPLNRHKKSKSNSYNNHRKISLKPPTKPAPKPPKSSKPPMKMRLNSNKCKVIMKGFMLKRGKYNISFKKRYFELLTNKQLYYYKNFNKGRGIDKKGVIDLNIVKRIVKIGENALNIVTINREWSFLCKSRYERDYWYIVMVKLSM